MLKNNLPLLKHGYGFHTSSKINGKPGNVMRKIMGMGKKKKFYPDNEYPMLPLNSMGFGKSSIETKITGNPRRSNMLNKLFMGCVTDIMASGEYSTELLGLGIEINKVKVSADYKYLRVYWIAKESVEKDDVESLLIKNAGLLKHELSTLRVMGQVPNIVFVKDKEYYKISEVQERLRKADFGEDYEQPDIAEQLKSELQLLTTLDDTIKEKLEKLELKSPDIDFIKDDMKEIPPMSQNILGLNHADILKRVKMGVMKSKALHRSTDTMEWMQWSEFKTTQPMNKEPVIFANCQEQREAFKAFLQQRQILRKKQNRLDKNWTLDRVYMEEELSKAVEENSYYEELIDEDDYILEDNVEDADIKQ